MFKKKNEHNSVDTIIGSKGIFRGNIEVDGGALIDGKIEGNVKVNGILIVGKEGYIIGEVWASDLIISGKIEGKVYIKNRVEVQNTGKIDGELHCKVLVVDEGGYVNGLMDMKYQEVE
ncbi:MAG: polymer-forming cytoskeletal protein [candidate division WOR-3 bacterium]|jgi:cytoskeletal protein CcmA (bactofilin family)